MLIRGTMLWIVCLINRLKPGSPVLVQHICAGWQGDRAMSLHAVLVVGRYQESGQDRAVLASAWETEIKVTLGRYWGSILWFLLHSLLNHEKWITCIFSVKNDSMTHKTINLSDMCYFQPPILIKITVNPLFQFLMLPDKTWKIHIFQSKIV